MQELINMSKPHYNNKRIGHHACFKVDESIYWVYSDGQFFWVSEVNND